MATSEDKPKTFYGRDSSALNIPEKTVKKSVDFSGLSEELQKTLQEAQRNSTRLRSLNPKHSANGIGGAPVPEARAIYIEGDTEKVVTGKTNAYVSFGKDRPSTIESGYGGLGHTQASAVNIVAGPMSFLMKSVDENQEKLYFNPSFEFDASRIYLSQKADIDGYMGLHESPGAPKSVTRSAIAMRSDAVRITARENIRLVTGFGEGRESDYDRRFNSQGSRTYSVGGIDLVAGNDTTDMQPLVKGDNLVDALRSIIDEIDKLNGIVNDFIHYQTLFNDVVIRHEHISSYPGSGTAPDGHLAANGTGLNTIISVQVKNKARVQKGNFGQLVNKYLTNGSSKFGYGKKFINSTMNHTN
tara:strand:+ start:66 stop:1136 length:1071 start_codon:yes stop_codon:yes gene_type:complete